MNEKWAVAFDMKSHDRGNFMWVRNAGGDIAVFETKIEAQKWVLTSSDVPDSQGNVVFIRIFSRN